MNKQTEKINKTKNSHYLFFLSFLKILHKLGFK